MYFILLAGLGWKGGGGFRGGDIWGKMYACVLSTYVFLKPFRGLVCAWDLEGYGEVGLLFSLECKKLFA